MRAGIPAVFDLQSCGGRGAPLKPKCDRAKVIEFIDEIEPKLVPWQRHLIISLLCGDDQ